MTDHNHNHNHNHNPAHTPPLHRLALEDLAKSGLAPEDVLAQPATPQHWELCGCRPPYPIGYVVPYDCNPGQQSPSGHFRIKVLEAPVATPAAKYLQPKNTGNFLYFPPNLKLPPSSAQPQTRPIKQPFLIITEGEKKAAKAVKEGFPTVALGGVDCWRNRRFLLKVDKVKLISAASSNKNTQKTQGVLEVTLSRAHPGTSSALELEPMLAIGFEHILELDPLPYLVIIFDTDGPQGLKSEVARAAADFYTHLVLLGYPAHLIKQVVLPALPNVPKTGLDDFLTTPTGPQELRRLIQNALASPHAVPTHPNLPKLVNRLLEQRPSRSDLQRLAVLARTQLDSEGMRIAAPLISAQTILPGTYKPGEGVEEYYYYHNKGSRVYKIELGVRSRQLSTSGPFGALLKKRLGVSGADSRFLHFLGEEITTGDPKAIYVAKISKGLHPASSPPDYLDVQLGPSKYMRITANKIEIKNNGEGGRLFYSEKVLPVDLPKLVGLLSRANKLLEDGPWWLETLKQSKFKKASGLTPEQTLARNVAAMYILPWLNRWRGLLSPIELWHAEPGSGKTVIQQLRMYILTGKSRVDSMTGKISDIHAALCDAPGFFVGDNIDKLTGADRTSLESELARFTTEVEPTIQKRLLYTTNTQVEYPFHASIVLTAKKMPYYAEDLLQRTLLIELEPVGDDFTSGWWEIELNRRGGREAWLAHHAVVIQEFFRAVRERWDPNRRSSHRLTHWEQTLEIMLEVLELSDVLGSNVLHRCLAEPVGEDDSVIEGLRHYLVNTGIKEFTVNEASEYFLKTLEFYDDPYLTNPRRLGRYFKSHSDALRRRLGITMADKKKHNRYVYKTLKTVEELQITTQNQTSPVDNTQ